MQAGKLVSETKELLWEDPEERMAMWTHCENLLTTHRVPPGEVSPENPLSGLKWTICSE